MSHLMVSMSYFRFALFILFKIKKNMKINKKNNNLLSLSLLSYKQVIFAR